MGGQRTRTVELEEPAVTAAGALDKTGIAVLREIIAGTLPAAPLQATLGYRLVDVSDGFARLELVPGEHLVGQADVLSSGIAATLLDAAMSAAVMTTLDGVTSHTTAVLTAHLTRAIAPRALKLLAEGWVVHRGSRLVTAEARLTDDQGRLLAHGSATCTLSERASG
jgi:uncharacterized protein (TIGR00369 family)